MNDTWLSHNTPDLYCTSGATTIEKTEVNRAGFNRGRPDEDRNIYLAFFVRAVQTARLGTIQVWVGVSVTGWLDALRSLLF